MARPNLDQIRGTTDFQKTYYWNLTFLNLPTGGFFTNIAASSDQDRLNMQCTSTEVPTWEGETAMQMIKGYQVPDPGIYKPKAKLNLTFVEMIDSQLRSGWDQWMAACRNKETLFSGLFADVQLATTNNQGTTNYIYLMRWCFPETTDPQELDSENSNPMTFKATLVYTDLRVINANVGLDAIGRFAPG